MYGYLFGDAEFGPATSDLAQLRATGHGTVAQLQQAADPGWVTTAVPGVAPAAGDTWTKYLPYGIAIAAALYLFKRS